MKALKIGFAIFAAALLAVGISTKSQAFHSGGVAECEGCHTMHNSLDGAPVEGSRDAQFQAGKYLLKGSDQSSACLNCHNSADTAPTGYHVSTDGSIVAAPGVPPVEMTPGGDFAWLKKTYEFKVRGNPATDHGERHGHNVVAVDYDYVADSTLTVAPGGGFTASVLACSSCHDPHGKYRRLANASIVTTGLPIFNSGSYNNSKDPIADVSAVGVYRLLAGVGYQPKSWGGFTPFAYNPPAAVSPSSYNRSEWSTAGEGSIETLKQTHVAYGSGMSEWCANCHTQMLSNAYVSGNEHLRHPAGNSSVLGPTIAGNYNQYVSSGKMTNADPTKAYSTLVPFELGYGFSVADTTLMKGLAVNTDTKDQSATATSRVMCLSCHRAHASGFESMARYSLTNEFMTIADTAGVAKYDDSADEGKVNFGKNVAEQQAAYYGRPASVFGPYARNLCNKCHAKD